MGYFDIFCSIFGKLFLGTKIPNDPRNSFRTKTWTIYIIFWEGGVLYLTSRPISQIYAQAILVKCGPTNRGALVTHRHFCRHPEGSETRSGKSPGVFQWELSHRPWPGGPVCSREGRHGLSCVLLGVGSLPVTMETDLITQILWQR